LLGRGGGQKLKKGETAIRKDVGGKGRDWDLERGLGVELPGGGVFKLTLHGGVGGGGN